MKSGVAAFAGLVFLACSGADPDAPEVKPVGEKPSGEGTKVPALPGATNRAETVDLAPYLFGYTIAVDAEHSVTYRAYRDGAVIVGGLGKQNDENGVMGNVARGSTRPLDLYQKVHPGEAVPQEVLDLEAFMSHSQPEAEVADEYVPLIAPTKPASTLVEKAITSDAATFLQAFGCFFGAVPAGTPGGDVFDGCVLWWEQGDNAVQASSRWAIYKMGAYEGSLRFQVSVSGTPRFVQSLGEGGFWYQVSWKNIREHDNGGSRYPDVAGHRLDIHSTGKYHFSGRFHNYRVGSWSCAEVLNQEIFSPWTFPACFDHYGGIG
jgi:hypothetical protein